LGPLLQLGYCRGHSTETALLKVINDLLLSADSGEVTALCLLNLPRPLTKSMISCCLLGCKVGLEWLAKCWNGFSHIYTIRTYSVTYASSMSDVVHLACSVSQSSVLGPLHLELYTAELVDIAAEIGINIDIYSDDTQLHAHCKPSDTTDAIDKLERCIAVVDKWMAASRLKMNSDV